MMTCDLKRLVDELERVLIERGGSLDAPALDDLKTRIESLKKAIDTANTADMHRLRVDALNVMAALLSAVTNVMSLLR